MIFRKKNSEVYFVHIPKNAGNSIRAVCKEENIKVISHNIRKRNKRLLATYRAKKDLHAFCVSRNPYDRTVSAYHYFLSNSSAKTREDELDREEFISPYSDFRDFVCNGLKQASERQLHFLPQVFWIRDKYGSPRIESTLKMENLQEDFNAFCREMGFQQKELPVTNLSDRNDSWKSYYTDETKRIVSGIYHEDFEYFGYNK